MFKIFVTVDSINASDLLSVNRDLSGLNIRPATLNSFVSNSKFLTICFRPTQVGDLTQHMVACLWIALIRLLRIIELLRTAVATTDENIQS